jgi:hypothetical protein
LAMSRAAAEFAPKGGGGAMMTPDRAGWAKTEA